ncbi:hypothetical protein [Candidatus Poriferisodalis sp.]|uniref:hypothetical protein n=1 Tax=Candidatus Poriferisodalis sp. TaxID=3101277 RepID=UPI003B012C18
MPNGPYDHSHYTASRPPDDLAMTITDALRVKESLHRRAPIHSEWAARALVLIQLANTAYEPSDYDRS